MYDPTLHEKVADRFGEHAIDIEHMATEADTPAAALTDIWRGWLSFTVFALSLGIPLRTLMETTEQVGDLHRTHEREREGAQTA